MKRTVPNYDFMLHLSLEGKPLDVVVYERESSLPRHSSSEIDTFDSKHKYPAEHSPDMIAGYYKRAKVVAVNEGEGCLCNCPVLQFCVPRHNGDYDDRQSQYLCDKHLGFREDEVEYYLKDRFGDGIYLFAIGSWGRGSHVPPVLNALAADGWSLRLAGSLIHELWGNIPEVKRSIQIHEMLNKRFES